MFKMFKTAIGLIMMIEFSQLMLNIFNGIQSQNNVTDSFYVTPTIMIISYVSFFLLNYF